MINQVTVTGTVMVMVTGYLLKGASAAMVKIF